MKTEATALSETQLRWLFFGFAILIASRDIFAESPFKERPTIFAFWLAVTITAVSGLLLLLARGFQTLVVKLSNPPVASRVFVLGALTAIIYWVTFVMIARIGAGDFNLVDYGLAPLLTASIGFAFFKGERPEKVIFFAFVLYLAGLWLMIGHQERSNLRFLPLALLSPVTTSVSDGLTKWLLEDGGLTRPELLFVRFLPACPVLFVAAIVTDGNWRLMNWGMSFPLSIICGFVPLWLLCTGLGRTALARYAVWEFLIPVAAFVGTLQWHPEHRHLTPLVGSILIVLGLIVNEYGFPSRFRQALFRPTSFQ